MLRTTPSLAKTLSVIRTQQKPLFVASNRFYATASSLNVTPQPAITLYDAETKDPVTTDQLFKNNRKVVVFGVPGAFTPTCSNKHVPSYQQQFEELLKNKVDEVICLSVNDVFVMKAWRESVGEKKIRYLADPAANFVKSLGLDVDLSGANLGVRSKRFSMLVDNGKVKFLNIEDSPGNFDKTSAEHLLEQLKSN